MSAGSQHIAALFCRSAGAYRNAACKPLCKGNDVGLDAVVLDGKEFARPADAALYLVTDHKYVFLVAYLADSFYELLVERYNAALALYTFKHYRADTAFVLLKLRHKVGGVIGGNVHKAAEEREEVVVENVLTRGGERGHRSAVEAVHQRDDNITLGVLAVFVKAVFSCDLDRALVCLGARVAEEYLLHSRKLAELCGKVGLHLGVVVVRGVLDRVSLSAYRICPLFVAVAERVGADARAEVDVLPAVLVNSSAAFALFEHKIIPAVAVHDVLVEFFDGLAHFSFLFPYQFISLSVYFNVFLFHQLAEH